MRVMRNLILGLAAVVLFSSVAGAEDNLSPPASEWRSYCQSYIKAVDGDTTISDLDVTYCLGVTKGLLNGMRIGSQVGAVSFASRMVVQYKLDADEVFKLFSAQEPARILGVCAPKTNTTPDYVRVVLKRLEKTPADAKRPIAEVFYEALQEAYPCN
jgi:hypothetical protein